MNMPRIIFIFAVIFVLLGIGAYLMTGVQAAFAVLSLIFVALCVKSFVDARRARTANPS